MKAHINIKGKWVIGEILNQRSSSGFNGYDVKINGVESQVYSNQVKTNNDIREELDSITNRLNELISMESIGRIELRDESGDFFSITDDFKLVFIEHFNKTKER